MNIVSIFIYLIFVASKFGNFRRLTYFDGFSIECPLKLSFSEGATLKGKNMPPVGNIFFPLTEATFQNGYLDVEIDSTVQK